MGRAKFVEPGLTLTGLSAYLAASSFAPWAGPKAKNSIPLGRRLSRGGGGGEKPS